MTSEDKEREVKMEDSNTEGRKTINVHSRREFLKLSAATATAVALGSSMLWGCGGETATTTTGGGAATTATTGGAAGMITKPGAPWVSLFASLDNFYFLWWHKGAEQCGKALNLGYSYLVNDNKAETEISQMEAEVQKGTAMFFINTPGAGPVPKLAEVANKSKAYMANTWDNPDWWMPLDGGEYYVTYFLPPQVEPAYLLAKRLFKEMGGKGNLIHLAGPPGGTADWTRTMGVKKALAENPNIKLLDFRQSGWSRQLARPIMDDFVVKYGKEINGVFGQNDDVAIGCMNALEAAGMKGIPITGIDGNLEAMQLIQQGRMTATISSYPQWQGAYSGIRVFDAANGVKFSPVESVQHTGVLLVDKTNVDPYIGKFFNESKTLPFDWPLMSRALHPTDWDPQNEITCIKWEEFWASRDKPAGYTLPKAYTDAVAAGEREKIDKMYADQYKKKITEGIPLVQV
jgi:ribose transport system substrate-binding protein